jgi:hypothetical protein
VILFAIIAPKQFYHASKLRAKNMATWLPRVRPLGITALVLWVGARLLMLKLFPQFEKLIQS